MCYEHFSTHHEFTAHPVNCKNKKQCPKCPLTGEAFKLVKNFECHTEMCNGQGSFKCPHCDRVFPNTMQLGITNIDVQAKKHAMYATLWLRIPKLWQSMQRSTIGNLPANSVIITVQTGVC